MRLVFVNRFFYPDQSATSQLLSDLVFALGESRSDVHVITSRLLHEDPKTPLPPEENVAGIHVHRVRSSRFGRSGLPGRLSDYLTFYPSVFFCLVRLLRAGDIVVAKTDPPLISVVAWIAARLRHATLINWLQDLFPEVAAAVGVRGVGGRFGRFLTWLRDQTLREAAVNVVLGRRAAETLRARGIPDDRVSIIANWADGETIRPLAPDDNPLRREWGLSGKFIAGYSGNLGRAHEFDTILGAAELLRDDDAIVFVIIGSGYKLERVRAEAQRRGLSNVVFKPYQPKERLRHSLTLPDVQLVSLLPALEGYVVPSKFYGALAAGRPIVFIGAPDGELAQEIAACRCGITIEPHDAAGLAIFLQRLCCEPETARAMERNARVFFDRNFDTSHAISKWTALLDDMEAVAKGNVVLAGMGSNEPRPH